MSKQTFVFEGSLTAVEPLTVTIPGAGNLLPRNGGQDSAAYWPATSIRGALRHMAHRAVVAAVKEANNGAIPLDLADHFLLAQGVDIEGAMTIDEDMYSIDSKEKQVIDPMLSLFGYWKSSSKACIGNAFPPAGSTGMFGGGARGVMFERNPDLLEMLDDSQTDRLRTVLTEQTEASKAIQEIKNQQGQLRKQIKNADVEEKAVIRKKITELDQAIAARKEEKTEAKESIRRPIDQYEAIAAGTEMSHRMDLKGVTDIELGLFLAALVELARDPHMGGHRNHNCGRVSGRWVVKTWPADALAPIEVGVFSFGPEGVSMTGDVLMPAYQTWLAQRASLHFGKPISEIAPVKKSSKAKATA